MHNLHPAFFRAPLFSGMTQEDITALLPCLHSREKTYPKDSCLLRMDEPVNELGLLLEGAALIEQEDFWGNPQYRGAHHHRPAVCRGSRLQPAQQWRHGGLRYTAEPGPLIKAGVL